MTILNAVQEAASMGHRKKTSKRSRAKTILRLPDLEQAKNAVLNSLAAASSQESYGHAIDEFIGWDCSEPRLAFNRTVFLRYPFFLEQRSLRPPQSIFGWPPFGGPHIRPPHPAALDP